MGDDIGGDDDPAWEADTFTGMRDIKSALAAGQVYHSKQQVKYLVRKLNTMLQRWQRVYKSNTSYLRFMCRARFRAGESEKDAESGPAAGSVSSVVGTRLVDSLTDPDWVSCAHVLDYTVRPRPRR